MLLHCAKTAEQIDVLSGVEILGDPRHSVLDGSFDPSTAMGREGEETLPIAKYRNTVLIHHRHHLHNIIFLWC